MHDADDYLGKPFSLREVGARLGALIKRHKGEVATQELRFADARLDLTSLGVERAGRVIRLQPKCPQLLRIMMQAPGRVFGRAELESAVWGDEQPDSDTLRAHIYTLRKALTQRGESADRNSPRPRLRLVARNTGMAFVSGRHFTLRVHGTPSGE